MIEALHTAGYVKKKTKNNEHLMTAIFFAISLPSQLFLGCHLGFHIFFLNIFLGSCTLFSVELDYRVTVHCKIYKYSLSFHTGTLE